MHLLRKIQKTKKRCNTWSTRLGGQIWNWNTGAQVRGGWWSQVNSIVKIFMLLTTLQSVAQVRLSINPGVMNRPRPLGLHIRNDVCSITYDLDSAQNDRCWTMMQSLTYWNSSQSTCSLPAHLCCEWTSYSLCEGAVMGMCAIYAANHTGRKLKSKN